VPRDYKEKGIFVGPFFFKRKPNTEEKGPTMKATNEPLNFFPSTNIKKEPSAYENLNTALNMDL
jgi:hypothetical protein